jgi:hypothetical protein
VDPLLSDRHGLLAGIEDWAAWLRRSEDRATLERLRLYTRTGRPLGNDAFVERVEAATHRRLKPQPHGRPRRPPKEAENG